MSCPPWCSCGKWACAASTRPARLLPSVVGLGPRGSWAWGAALGALPGSASLSAACCGAEGPGLALSWAAPLLPKWPLRQAVPGQCSRHPSSAGPTSGSVYAGGSRALLSEPRVGAPASTSHSLTTRIWSTYACPHSWGSGVADPRLQGNPGVWRPDRGGEPICVLGKGSRALLWGRSSFECGGRWGCSVCWPRQTGAHSRLVCV